MEDAASGRGGNLLMAKLSEVADWVGVSAPAGDGEVTHVSSIAAATRDSVVFAVDSASLAAARSSKAGVILAGKSFKTDDLGGDSRIWQVDDPRYTFAVVAKRLKGKGFEAGVHAFGSGGSGSGDRCGDQYRAGGGAWGWSSYRQRLQYPGAGDDLCWNGAGRPRGGAGRSGAGVYRIWLCAAC